MASSSSSSRACSKLTSRILFAIFLQVLGLSFFVIGFFPVKPTLHGKSGLESYQMPTCESVVDDEESDLGPEQLRSLYKEMSGIPPTFDRLILMVVDGLPAEFVLGRSEQRPSKSMMEAMPYTQSLLSDGRAIGYHAKAAPPTVTMPRLKAMVSGAIGGFLDVAFNFNTQAFLDDNLLDQFYRIGWKMVILGDETWIKLFPGLFSRQDGVSSFYVKDTVEVDFNVSRHLEIELTSTDWNLLILHYLGLDHVGHIGGRRSILMAPKLKEMDEVIKMIHLHTILHQDNLDMRTLLVVVSDHGMTEGGNHGGSSYEETDSLAMFIGGDVMKSDYSSSGHNTAFQVDIAPTLAVLLGVPIPKNNIGVLLVEVLNSLTERQRLHALELNSWQLLRLLQAHLPGILCGNLSYYINEEHDSKIGGTISNTQERLYHLFSKASAAHNTREMHQQGSDFMNNTTDDLNVVVSSYHDFLRNASEWLSHRATDKPFKLLLPGVAILVVSCILFLILLYCLFEEALPRRKQGLLDLKEFSYSWHLDEAFVCFGILIHVISLGSSSMVEEEQYTWHFLASTLYLIFLFKTVESFLEPNRSGLIEVIKGRERNIFHRWRGTVACSGGKVTGHGLSLLKLMKDYYQIISVLVVLVCGRLLRGWHQGGVNWVDLPDISKWLEQAGVSIIRSLQIVSLAFLLLLNSFSICLIRSRIILADLSIFSHLASGLLVCLHIIGSQGLSVLPNSLDSTSVAQIFYLTISVTVVVTVLSSPWILYLRDYRTNLMTKLNRDCWIDNLINFPLLGVRDSMYLIGMTLSASWCLLQILLQQPINAVPTLLIFIQLFASIIYFSANGSFHRQWVEVVAIYYLGMSGHFGLGNSNSLATVDVAGAFIGISRHSTVLSGILMFVITYASPVLSFLSMLIYFSLKDLRDLSSTKDSELGCMLRRMIAFPCMLPLVLNSIVLTGFTIVLLLMRDHLFVWSVFSPKYLYVCGMTVSVYIGVSVIAATGLYVCIIITFRGKRLRSNVDTCSR